MARGTPVCLPTREQAAQRLLVRHAGRGIARQRDLEIDRARLAPGQVDVVAEQRRGVAGGVLEIPPIAAACSRLIWRAGGRGVGRRVEAVELSKRNRVG